MQPVGIGLLGAARITQNAIIKPCHDNPALFPAAIAARDRARAEAYGRQHGIAHILDTYEQLLTSDQTELIYNPLPVNLHAEWTIKALRAGKHVLCEKPFAMNLRQAEAMLASAESSGRRLIEAFHYRYHPAFETCLDWLAGDEIGELCEIEACFDVQILDDGSEIRHRVETGGGAMMDLGCYPLHWALSLTGETPGTIEARATLTPAGVDETLSTELSFPSGVRARLSTSMASGTPFRAEMKLTGTKGTLFFNNPLAPHNRVHKGRLYTSKGREAVISPVPTYSWQLAAVYNALRHDTKLPTEGDIIVRQQATLDAVYAAAGLSHLRQTD